MKAYFSSVDDSELNDNTEFHNYYLSLVVNNHGALVAKVAFRGDIKGYDCKDEKGESWNLRLTNQRQVMFTFDCKIESPRVLSKVPDAFAKRTKEIMEVKAKKQKVFEAKSRQYQSIHRSPYPGSNSKHLPAHKPYDKKKGYNPFDYLETDDESEVEAEMWNASFTRPEKVGKYQMTGEERLEDFTRYLLRLADDSNLVSDSLEEALEDTAIIDDKANYLNSLITMYPAIFEKYWDIFGEIDTEKFVDITENILDILEQYEGVHDIVKPLSNGLHSMIIKMMAHG